MSTEYDDHCPELIASLISTLPRLENLDWQACEQLEEQLISDGYTYFWIRGALIEQLNERGVSLHVEDIQSFLLDYVGLESYTMVDQPYKHNAFIAEGTLETVAFSDRQTVNFTMEYRVQYPEPIRKNLTFTLPETEYVQWWRSLAHQIIECTKTPHPSKSQVNV